MEKIILRRLTYHLDTRNLLPKEQYGFRKGHGTIDQLLIFTQKVKDAQNRKLTNHTIAAFLDLTQAFDKVWKNKLITKLYKHFKIDGKAITWINDFLKNRYIRVKYNGTLSKTFELYQGLPQGSVLSPTLFTLFIAGIEEKISHKTNIGLFADDIILWSSNTNWKKAERDLNKTLFHLEKFANKHKLEFNPQKFETCLFTTDKKLYKIRPKIILKEQQLQYNKHPKYLGYTLDPEINSSKHIEVIRKRRDRLKILKYISGREWGADATTLKLTYTSLIRPILEYGYQICEKISPCKPLQNVIFNATLNEPINKQYQNPEYLKQLSLEIINNIPKNAITIYTDGSRDELGHTGSGCLIKTTNGIEKMNRRNPDFCSVLRSELIAIYEALKSIRNTNYQDIWILTDSRSAIQHLSHTGELRDKVRRNIIGYLQKLSKTSKIHLQWIPSHVGIEGNEAADVLAKKGTKEPLPQKNKLTFKEIETIAKTKINKNWRISPKHSWYSGVNPGGALKIRIRQHQTTLTRFRTGHLKPLKIENNNKIYPTCPKCSLVPAAPEHILACIRCTKQDLWDRPLLIIKQLEEHELMEFVSEYVLTCHSSNTSYNRPYGPQDPSGTNPALEQPHQLVMGRTLDVRVQQLDLLDSVQSSVVRSHDNMEPANLPSSQLLVQVHSCQLGAIQLTSEVLHLYPHPFAFFLSLGDMGGHQTAFLSLVAPACSLCLLRQQLHVQHFSQTLNWLHLFIWNLDKKDSIFYFIQQIQETHSFHHKPTKSTIAAFIDLSQAFDRVWKEKLILKLDKLGIEGTILYPNAPYRLISTTKKSKTTHIYQGLPQGSILSPILFNIYLNDVHTFIKPPAKIALYADDIIIWVSKNNLSDAEHSLNKAMKNLQKVTQKLELSININSPRYLGFTVDPALTFKKHIDTYMINKANNRLKILKKILGLKWGTNANILCTTYFALVRPILQYAAPAWINASKTNLSRIDRIQASAAKIISGLQGSCPNRIAKLEFNLLPLHLRRKICFSKFITKKINSPKEHLTGKLIKIGSPKPKTKTPHSSQHGSQL
ncbi:hypothetical protein LAZ67_5002897 [Cordylochernes scorpioides]|uniref:Reverse transcriptase n=1 Tax=Cordylochernes scorpioides TaxID=51811 RepID=A0ABY6KH22_9ARAC|nr:hypothetical protein LAZ67_5002897 [Cordylochernes scorpioides]